MQLDKEMIMQLLDETATLKTLSKYLKAKDLKDKVKPKIKALQTELESILSEMTK